MAGVGGGDCWLPARRGGISGKGNNKFLNTVKMQCSVEEVT